MFFIDKGKKTKDAQVKHGNSATLSLKQFASIICLSSVSNFEFNNDFKDVIDKWIPYWNPIFKIQLISPSTVKNNSYSYHIKRKIFRYNSSITFGFGTQRISKEQRLLPFDSSQA